MTTFRTLTLTPTLTPTPGPTLTLTPTPILTLTLSPNPNPNQAAQVTSAAISLTYYRRSPSPTWRMCGGSFPSSAR